VTPDRLDRYIGVVRPFAASVLVFHNAVADRVGLHISDLRCLLLLADHPRTPGTLAAQLGITPAAVTAMVDRLESDGYVTRRRDSGDRRKVMVSAQPDRLAAVEEAYEAQGRAMRTLLGEYDDKEFAAIIDFLGRTPSVISAALRQNAV
jgi:DNA-binding MarR family transcriptional regulator